METDASQKHRISAATSVASGRIVASEIEAPNMFANMV
jgi:hypothetical protein